MEIHVEQQDIVGVWNLCYPVITPLNFNDVFATNRTITIGGLNHFLNVKVCLMGIWD